LRKLLKKSQNTEGPLFLLFSKKTFTFLLFFEHKSTKRVDLCFIFCSFVSMKVFFSIFFLLVMFTSVTVSLVEQWQGEDVSELKECKTDDADDTDGEEKVEKEKEVYTFNHKSLAETSLFSTRKLKKTNHYGKDSFISELYASLPELPPEA
jgi:hypothetical protein